MTILTALILVCLAAIGLMLAYPDGPDRYAVFDCTKETGVACHVPTRPLARLAARLLTNATGRFHDYDRA